MPGNPVLRIDFCVSNDSNPMPKYCRPTLPRCCLVHCVIVLSLASGLGNLCIILVVFSLKPEQPNDLKRTYWEICEPQHPPPKRTLSVLRVADSRVMAAAYGTSEVSPKSVRESSKYSEVISSISQASVFRRSKTFSRTLRQYQRQNALFMLPMR